jgi:hypothetical protein
MLERHSLKFIRIVSGIECRKRSSRSSSSPMRVSTPLPASRFQLTLDTTASRLDRESPSTTRTPSTMQPLSPHRNISNLDSHGPLEQTPLPQRNLPLRGRFGVFSRISRIMKDSIPVGVLDWIFILAFPNMLWQVKCLKRRQTWPHKASSPRLTMCSSWDYVHEAHIGMQKET